MPAGYSGTPLAKKLGIKPGMEVVALGAPPDFPSLLDPIPEGARIVGQLPASAALIHFFTTERAVLEAELPRLKGALEPDGILWLSWPKKAAKVPVEPDLVLEVLHDESREGIQREVGSGGAEVTEILVEKRGGRTVPAPDLDAGAGHVRDLPDALEQELELVRLVHVRIAAEDPAPDDTGGQAEILDDAHEGVPRPPRRHGSGHARLPFALTSGAAILRETRPD